MESPYSQASILSKLFFKWPNSIIQLAKTKDELNLDDIPPVPYEYNVFKLHDEFIQLWNMEKKKETPSLAKVILHICWRKNAWIAVIVFTESIARIYQAVALGKFIGFLLDDNNTSTSVYDNGYFISFLITLCAIIITFAHHQFFFYAWGLGLQVRLILTSTIYSKASRLHLRSLNSLPSGYGHIVNLCSQDVEAFQLAGTFLHFVYQPVVESLGVLFVGIWTIGVSFLAGFAFILLLLPLQAFFSHQLSYSRKNTSKHTDERIKLINQAITGIRLVKINGWELIFVAMIERIRSLEIKALLRTTTLRAVNEAIFFITPVLVGFFTFMTYSQTGGVLTAQKVLTVLTLFNISQMSMTKFFPFAIQYLSEARVGARRIQHLLLLDETEALSKPMTTAMATQDNVTESFQSPSSLTSSPKIVVQFENFNASWNYYDSNNSNCNNNEFQAASATPTTAEVRMVVQSSRHQVSIANKDETTLEAKEEKSSGDEFSSFVITSTPNNSNMTLSNINLSVSQGELILVVGAVGASKTSLLLAVLRELQSLPEPAGGRVTLNQDMLRGSDSSGDSHSTNNIAYCAQEPWILSTSVRDNVLFGQPYDAVKFKQVITACAMNHDFELLPHREHTVVGSRGINLSGGQKARLALARCLYADTGLYLLDDPLSAVDATVSNILFHQAICGYLATKTRVLVTHQIQFLSSPHVSRIVVMAKGAVVFCGKFSELQHSEYSSEFTEGVFGESSGSSNVNNDDTSDNAANTIVSIDAPATNSFDRPTSSSDSSSKNPNASTSHNTNNYENITKNTTTSNINTIPGNKSGSGSKTSSNSTAAMKNHSMRSNFMFTSGIKNASMKFDFSGRNNRNKNSFYNSVNSNDNRKEMIGFDAAVGVIDNEMVADKSVLINDTVANGDNKSSLEKEQQAVAVIQGITVAEDREIGVVKFNTFTKYFHSMGGAPAVLLIMLLLMLGQVLAVLANIWLAQWSRMTSQDQQGDYVMNIYILLVLLALAGAFLRSLVFFHFSIIAAESIHNSMLLCILRAPVLFFDSNPHGRILNRFSRDIGVIDDQLPGTVYDFFQCILMVCAAVVVVVIGTPYILIAILPLCYYFIVLRGYFIKPSRDIKRIEGVSRSPIFTHLSETIDGLVTIRALGRLQAFTTQFNEYINKNASVYFAFVAVSRWLGFRLDTIVVVLLLVSTIGATAAKEYNAGIQPVILAVGVMYILQLSGLFQWAVRQSAEVENMMVSVERVSAYTQVPSEPALHSKDSKDSDSSNHSKYDKKMMKSDNKEWPTKGEIVMEQLTCSYRHDLPPIIKNLSLCFQGGERIGVVGRTGAGKSTLISAILRLVDITSGRITIDGVDITSVGLHDLRPKISVIPQVPFLFSGTIRKNLDTLDQYSDLQIWNAIDAVQGLRTVINQLSGRKQIQQLHQQKSMKKLKRNESKASLPPRRNESKASLSSQQSEIQQQQHERSETKSAKSFHELEPLSSPQQQQQIEECESGLQGMCEENGSNFSVGERQLFCLARAILQHNSILILDEATSNIDMETDTKIQATICKEFPYATVIMIAHRLQTVIDCDKIVVMKNGEIVEVGHPYELLAKHFKDKEEDDDNSLDVTIGNDIDNFESTIKSPITSSIIQDVPTTSATIDGDKKNNIRDSFADMVKETGDNMSRQLFLQSSQSFKLKHSSIKNSSSNLNNS